MVQERASGEEKPYGSSGKNSSINVRIIEKKRLIMRKDFIDAFEYAIMVHKIFLKEKNDMLKCKICGCEFHAVNEKHYISRDNKKIGLSAAFGSELEVTLYDTYDCPACGCRVTVQERKREYITSK